MQRAGDLPVAGAGDEQLEDTLLGGGGSIGGGGAPEPDPAQLVPGPRHPWGGPQGLEDGQRLLQRLLGGALALGAALQAADLHQRAPELGRQRPQRVRCQGRVQRLDRGLHVMTGGQEQATAAVGDRDGVRIVGCIDTARQLADERVGLIEPLQRDERLDVGGPQADRHCPHQAPPGLHGAGADGLQALMGGRRLAGPQVDRPQHHGHRDLARLASGPPHRCHPLLGQRPGAVELAPARRRPRIDPEVPEQAVVGGDLHRVVGGPPVLGGSRQVTRVPFQERQQPCDAQAVGLVSLLAGIPQRVLEQWPRLVEAV